MSSDERIISVANLSAIESGLSNINLRLDTVDTKIASVNGDIVTVYNHVESVEDVVAQIQAEIEEFRRTEQRHHDLQDANEKIVQVNQKLDKQFGHYDEVRRTTTGILQATDIGIVHSQKITDVVEEAQLKCPKYWLAPCLVALAAWINDDEEAAKKAVREGIRRNDEKTSLFFGLVDRRMQRNDAAALWMQRYLVHEDPTSLHRHALVVVDAYSSGLFPAGTKDLIGDEFAFWLDYLEDQDGFHEKQVESWKDRFALYKGSYGTQVSTSDYRYLREYSPTWGQLEEALSGAKMHHIVARKYRNIFETPIEQQSALDELDESLSSLVTSYDDEELPLRREEQWYSAVIKYDGDITKAQAEVDADDSLDEYQDFGKLLTTAAFDGTDSSGSLSTQKYAIAMSRDWALEAYRKLVAENRQNVPIMIEMKIDKYDAMSRDGSDVEVHVQGISDMVEKELQELLAELVMTDDDEKMKTKGYAFLIAGAVVFVLLAVPAIVVALIVGAILAFIGYSNIASYKGKEMSLKQKRDEAKEAAEKKRNACIEIVRATCAEIVDWRAEYAKWNADSAQVTDFFEALDPENYIRALSGSPRALLDTKKIPAEDTSAKSSSATETKE